MPIVMELYTIKINLMYLKLYSSLILFFLCSGLSAQNTNQYPDFKLYFGSKNDVENFYSCEYEFSPLMMPEKLQDIETKSFQKEIQIILYTFLLNNFT